MSASPAERTPGMTPNGTPRPTAVIRRAPIDPLVRRKPQKRSVPPKPTKPTDALNTNGTQQPSRNGVLEQPYRLGEAQSTSLNLLKAAIEPLASGFSDAEPGTYVDYPVFITKRALMEGLRPHVARFASKQSVDPSNEAEFTRPVRLHRRDPKAPPPGSKLDGPDLKDAALEEEMEKHELIRAQRDAQRQAELAVIAPSVNNPNARRGGAAQKKTQQVLRKDETEEQRAGTRLKYEEALPWHLEDFDNKQTWVGSYEAALSETYAQIAFNEGRFSITPLEKWYKFTQKRNFKTEEELSAASQKREKKLQDPQWLVRQRELEEKRQTEEMYRRVTKGLYVGKAQAQKATKVAGGAATVKREADDDELDFDEDIADDEEDPVYEGDVDETKETQTRIKRDQLQANIFDLKDEKAYEREEQREKKEKETLKAEGKRVRKALMKRERNHIYDSDSDHAYSEQSESEDSEAERRKEEELKKETEEKKAEDKKSKSSQSSQGATGAVTKGGNTPSNRASKHPDPSKRIASNNLKRVGSPNASDASGNESTRKKQKKKHGISSNLGTGANTPNGPPSRSRSPMPAPPSSDPTSRPNAQLPKNATGMRPQELKRSRPGAASGSDGEAAGSGGEMSDGTRKRIKLKMGKPDSQNGSPEGSRATSPNRGPASSVGSRAVSPDTASQPSYTAAQLKAAIPPAGITTSDLLKRFNLQKNSLSGARRETFLALVKTVSVYEKSTKLLKPKKDT